MYKNSPHEIALISNNSFLVGSVVIAAANHVVFPASTPAIVIAELQAEQDSGLPTTANISCSSNAFFPYHRPLSSNTRYTLRASKSSPTPRICRSIR
jgi:hypothetical protein